MTLKNLISLTPFHFCNLVFRILLISPIFDGISWKSKSWWRPIMHTLVTRPSTHCLSWHFWLAVGLCKLEIPSQQAWAHRHIVGIWTSILSLQQSVMQLMIFINYMIFKNLDCCFWSFGCSSWQLSTTRKCLLISHVSDWMGHLISIYSLIDKLNKVIQLLWLICVVLLHLSSSPCW